MHCVDCFATINYTLIEKLGSGCFGSVYHVRNSKGEEFAVKELVSKKSETFKHPTELLYLEHPNCVMIYESIFNGHKDNSGICHLYLSLELCEKKTLKNWIAENRTQESRPLASMKVWIQQILLALEHLHERGVIHRDLKPDNIFFSRTPGFGIDGILKIGDFGMIKRCREEEDQRAEGPESEHYYSTRNSYGARHYRAPELGKKKRKKMSFNNKVDIFSLGIVAAELMYPYKNRIVQDQVNICFRRKHKKRTFPWPLKELPEDAKQFLMDATEPFPWNRPSAKKLLEHPFLVDVTQQVQPVDECSTAANTVLRCGFAFNEVARFHSLFENTNDPCRWKIIIQCVQVKLTGSSERMTEHNEISSKELKDYFQDLYGYAERLQNHRITFLGLEFASLETLQSSYEWKHFKMIPSFKVWSMQGCKEFMEEVLGKDRIVFFNKKAVSIFIRQVHHFEMVAGSQEKHKRTFADLLEAIRNGSAGTEQQIKYQLALMSPLPTEEEDIALRVECIAHHFFGTRIGIPFRVHGHASLLGYLRLLISSCMVLLLSEKAWSSFKFSCAIDEVSFVLKDVLILPTFDLYFVHPPEHWDSWFEIVARFCMDGMITAKTATIKSIPNGEKKRIIISLE